jgi:hypothetical protein
MSAPGSQSAPPRGSAVDVFSVDGGCSQIFGTASQGGRCRHLLALMVAAPRYLVPPHRGPVVDILQLSGSRSQTFWQRLLGGHYEQDVF